jgi:formylglycine-generating enzyme required for sulfatase activity
MRKILIAVLCAAAAASQAFAQSACSAPDGALLEVDNYAALTKKLSTIDQKAFVKDEWETEREFAARVEPIVEKIRSSLDLDRYYTLKKTYKIASTYDIERGVLKVELDSLGVWGGSGNGVSPYTDDMYFSLDSAILKNRPFPDKSESVSYRFVDAKPEKQKQLFVSAGALDVETWEYWLPPRSREDEQRCSNEYPALVLGSECRPSDLPLELPVERERARKIKDKLQVAVVFKPRYPFYDKRLEYFVRAEPPHPVNQETLVHHVYGAMYCAVLLDDEGRKMATLYTGYRPASEERQKAEAAVRAEKEKAEAAARAAVRHKAAIASLQTALIDKGYQPGNTDGEISDATVDAIEAFSAASGYSLVAVDLKAIDAAAIEALSLTVLESPVYHPKLAQIFTDCTECPSMVVLPPGSFVMGSPEAEEGRDKDEGPQRKVTIGSPFAVGRFEVTSAEWDACKADGDCDDLNVSYPTYNKESKAPIVRVTWDDAQAYVSWLTRKTGQQYRLLTEAEWEYAARAGTTTPFSFGSTIMPSQANYDGRHEYRENYVGYSGAIQVGSFPANAWGLYDMHGNVSELTQDCWNKNYRRAPTDGSAWTAGDCSKRVIRGGHWMRLSTTSSGGEIRSASRSWTDSTGRYTSVGFRVARTLPVN